MPVREEVTESEHRQDGQTSRSVIESQLVSSSEAFGSVTHRSDPVIYDLDREADCAAIEGKEFGVSPMARCAFVIDGQPKESAHIEGKKASCKEKRSLSYIIPWRMADQLENGVLMDGSVLPRQ